VNLGGLFVLEPFISPALFQRYPGAVDEWTLSVLMAADTDSGGLNQLEDHYNTFIVRSFLCPQFSLNANNLLLPICSSFQTEKDIADIAGAGLNWVRLPIPYWAIETWDGEPFLAKTSWK
jgi:glucan 1,3-beta-glucosidase